MDVTARLAERTLIRGERKLPISTFLLFQPIFFQLKLEVMSQYCQNLQPWILLETLLHICTMTHLNG
jgi:hypothetical protein